MLVDKILSVFERPLCEKHLQQPTNCCPDSDIVPCRHPA